MIKQNSEKQYFLVLEQKNKVTITIPIEKSPIFNNLEERFKNKPMSLAAICAFTIQFDSAANLRHHLIENQLIPGFEDNMHYASVLTTTNFSIADQSGMPITNTPLFGSYVQQVGFLINDPVSSILELFNSKLIEIGGYTEYLKKILNLIRQHLDQEWRKYLSQTLAQRYFACKRLEEYIGLISASPITQKSWDEFNSKLPQEMDFDSFVSLSVRQLIFNTYYDEDSKYVCNNLDDLDWQVILIILGFDINFQKEQEHGLRQRQVKRRNPKQKKDTQVDDNSDGEQFSFF